MSRDWLAERLEQGQSFAAIAKECGRHPSTVAYWAHKHGLSSRHAELHAARGQVSEATVRSCVEAGMTITEMSAELGIGSAAVRHWPKRFGLKTARARERVESSATGEPIRRCRRHGSVPHVRRRDGSYRCKRCRVEHVTSRRRRVKQLLVAEAGGRCVLCGYDRYPGALQFHHLDPAMKSFAVSDQGIPRSIARARAEAMKCVLLCANCHSEVEAGIATIPPTPSDGDGDR